MAVPSRIGIELSDGTIQSVYHHHLGYSRWLGRTLESHYDTEQKVSELISGGDMTSCWIDTRSVYGLPPIKSDEFGQDYYSNLGMNRPPQTHQNLEEYLNFSVENGSHFAYVFSEDSWSCYRIIDQPSPLLISIEY